MITSLGVITISTPDGDFHIIVDSESVAHASGFGDIDSLKMRLPADLQSLSFKALSDHPYKQLVRDYYAGDAKALDKIKYSQPGTDFQKKVWQAIARIPYGKTLSYKQLAIESGNEAAIRAAGTICGLNRLILIIPCHRILKSDGRIGSYLYGPVIKESLLTHEGALTKQEALKL